ncbi:MAG TPA: transglutaminase, partial [Flavobacterium sp.]|nr:transglutaminase [Flavobacterium sp.]
RALNWTGRQINKDGSSVLIDLMPGWISREVVNMAVQLDTEGKVTGKAREQYFDYNALMFRENVAGINEESYIERMEKHYNGLEINAYKVTNDDMSKPVMEEYDFVHKNVSDVIGDKIFISPMMFLSKTENPFKQEKREYPIDFIYPSQDKYLINIVLPEGYVVESMPQSVAMAMEENIGSFKYNIAQTDNKIQLSVVVDINYATVSPDYYLTIRDFYQKMIEKQGEKIVLKKA